MSAFSRELHLVDLVVRYIQDNNVSKMTNITTLLTSLHLPLLLLCQDDLPSAFLDVLNKADVEGQDLIYAAKCINKDESLQKQTLAKVGNLTKIFPTHWLKLRDYCHVTLDCYSFGNEDHSNSRTVFQKFYADEGVVITRVGVWVREYQGEQVVGGIQVTWSNDVIKKFGGTDEGEKHEFSLEKGEYIHTVKVGTNNHWYLKVAMYLESSCVSCIFLKMMFSFGNCKIRAFYHFRENNKMHYQLFMNFNDFWDIYIYICLVKFYHN